MTDHEIQLDRGPAACVNFTCCVDDIFIRDEFVDDAAHTFTGRFRGKGESTRSGTGLIGSGGSYAGMAAGAIDNLAITTRYLDYKYGDAIDAAGEKN